MSGHTPGPWEVRLVRPNKDKGQDFEPTCSILAHHPDPSPHYAGKIRIADIPDPYTDEEVANARLIAAAPELLEQLKIAKSQIGAWSHEAGQRGSTGYYLLMEGFAAAIAKATGGAA